MLCLSSVLSEKLGQSHELILLKKQEVIKTESNKNNNMSLALFIMKVQK
tara:strand:- start:68 stop:214 length:147 start_codon:yes stop_codon:yes gene_type:complete